MKYICVANEDGEEETFVFPRHIDHDVMMEGVEALKNQTHGSWERELRTLVSAGFVDKFGACYGKSETLGVSSRQRHDTFLLQSYLGIV